MLGAVAQADEAGQGRGTLLEVKELVRYSAEQINQATQAQRTFVDKVDCGVRVVAVQYRTIGVKGEPADASAALVLPDGSACQQPAPLLGWARGTETDRNRQQAQLAAASAGYPLNAVYAARGYVVIASDYLGLGNSHYPFHPYLHADSEASTVIDALRAARLAGAQLGVRFSGKVMLGGYSQGGHVTMATQRAIERDHLAEFNLVASAPMSGAYDLPHTFRESWSGVTSAGPNPLSPYLLAYTVVAMQHVYGNLFVQPEDVFKPPYAQAVQGAFPGPLGLRAMIAQPPFNQVRSIDDVRQPGFAKAFAEQADTPFQQDLARNSTLDWTPKTPMMMCGTDRDGVVPFDNAARAQAAFAGRGVQVAVVNVDAAVPAKATGAQAHMVWASLACYSAMRKMLFDPARWGSALSLARGASFSLPYPLRWPASRGS
ncbi:lipase family protein [Pseudomonas sp.]|uniref:lipase family protein n=1 Tax=Pseudomonas sp. TaxID=306 RepID=UPI003CC5D273